MEPTDKQQSFNNITLWSGNGDEMNAQGRFTAFIIVLLEFLRKSIY